MAEKTLKSLCRLCLTDRFQSCNIFSDRSMSGSVIYEALNFVYNLEIYRDDGLPSHICQPCFWKMKEFEVYKMNAHCARSQLWEFRRKELNSEIEAGTPAEASESREISVCQDTLEGAIVVEKAVETEGNGENSGSQDREEAGRIESNPNVLQENIRVSNEINVLSMMEQVMVFPECLHEELIIKSEEEDQKPILESPMESSVTNADSHSTGKNATQDMDIENVIFHPRSIPCIPMSATAKKIKSFKELSTERGFSCNNRGVTCDICHKNLSSKTKLKRHMAIHINEKPYYSCGICGIKFTREDNRNRHQLKHEEGKITKKPPATKADSRPTELKAIQDVNDGFIISDVRSISYMPAVTEENTIGLETVSAEEGISCKDNGVFCALCRKRLSSKEKLKRHMTIHYDEKPYSCGVCGMRFKRSDAKKSHQLRHREVKIKTKTLQNWWKVV